MPKPIVIELVALALLMTSTSAHAEWRKLPPVPEGSTQYYDTNSVERSGTIVKLTWINDNPTANYVRIRKSSKTWSSQIIQAEYNCATHEYRIVINTLFAGHMGTGESFPSNSLSKWRDISDGYEMWRTTYAIACNSR